MVKLKTELEILLTEEQADRIYEAVEKITNHFYMDAFQVLGIFDNWLEANTKPNEQKDKE